MPVACLREFGSTVIFEEIEDLQSNWAFISAQRHNYFFTLLPSDWQFTRSNLQICQAGGKLSKIMLYWMNKHAITNWLGRHDVLLPFRRKLIISNNYVIAPFFVCHWHCCDFRSSCDTRVYWYFTLNRQLYCRNRKWQQKQRVTKKGAKTSAFLLSKDYFA